MLEGSVRKSGDTVRITVQLIRASDSTHLWSQTYDRKLTDVFKVQDEIAQGRGCGAAGETAAGGAGTACGCADGQCRGVRRVPQGPVSLVQADARGPRRRRTLFQLGAEQGPGLCARPRRNRAALDGSEPNGIYVAGGGVPKAKAAALKAVELDDTLADAHYVLAIVYTWADWNWPAAESEFRRAIQLNPGFADAHAYYAHLLNILRRPDEAMVEARRALELDPFNGLFRALYGVDLALCPPIRRGDCEFNTALATNPTDARGALRT